MLSPGIPLELGDFPDSASAAFTQLVSLSSCTPGKRNPLGFIDPLVLTDVLRVPKKEVLFHFHEYRNPSREFMHLCKVLWRLSTNLLIFLPSLYVAVLWALSDKSFPTFQEIPVVVHMLRNVKWHYPGGFVEAFCKPYTVYLGKNQRENKTLLFSYYRTLTLYAEINERAACGGRWHNQGVMVSEAGCS